MKIGSRVLDYGSMHLLGPHDPNIVSGPQNPKSKKILRFHNFFCNQPMILMKMRYYL